MFFVLNPKVAPLPVLGILCVWLPTYDNSNRLDHGTRREMVKL